MGDWEPAHGEADPAISGEGADAEAPVPVDDGEPAARPASAEGAVAGVGPASTGGGPETEDDFFDALPDEDPVQMIMEMGQHPRMQRVQAALYEQLAKEHERVLILVRERSEELKRTQKERENTGVALYGYQQQLARLHVQLEDEYNRYNDLVREREEEERVAGDIRSENQERSSLLEEHRRQLERNQQELRGLEETIRQVERYNEQMQSEIAVTRRATYKAEEAVKELEKEKEGQDVFIDALTQQVKGLRDTLATLEAQVREQRESTAAADDILKETANEMELISFEKKQLMQQWRSALIGLSRRDEALAAAKAALNDAAVSTGDYEMEIDGLKRELRAAQREGDTLASRRDKAESESKFVEDALARTRSERDVLEERYALLQRSLGTMEEEEDAVDDARKGLVARVAGLEKDIQAVARERQRMESGIYEHRSAQTTASKATRSLNRKSQALVARLHEIELEAANIENETSRINVDKLNTEAHSGQLRGTLDKLVEELRGRDRLIEKYQMEIRQRNDAIEKKMYRVDRLNRKYEKMMDGVEDEESMGPLEATIKNLRRELENVGKGAGQLQSEWLRDQTQLVATASETEELRDENAELRAQVSILTQKRLRLAADVSRQASETQRLQSSVQSMHQDMTRLNDQIGRNAREEDEIKNANFVMEREFMEVLKELEAESVALEQRASSSRSEKATLSEEILEAERQLLLWEKKIDLERETQAALNPEAGQAEVRSMEREIHRMRIRRQGLQREQEKLISDMERAIYKREAIQTRFRGKKQAEAQAASRPIKRRPGGGVGGAAPEEYTRAGLQRRLAQLRRELQKAVGESERFEEAVAARADQASEAAAALEGATAEYRQLEEDAKRLQAEINAKLYEKQRVADLLERKQRLARRFHDLEGGAIEPAAPEKAPEVERQLSDAEAGLGAVKGLVGRLRDRFPHLGDVLDRVSNLCEEP